jgi:integral membrane protein
VSASRAVTTFRAVSLIEGISYIVLLAIAMPLKYVAGHPEVVTHAGRIHGALFVVFIVALLAASREQGWDRRAQTTAFIAAILPLGAFWLERQFRTGRFPSAAPPATQSFEQP